MKKNIDDVMACIYDEIDKCRKMMEEAYYIDDCVQARFTLSCRSAEINAYMKVLDMLNDVKVYEHFYK